MLEGILGTHTSWLKRQHPATRRRGKGKRKRKGRGSERVTQHFGIYCLALSDSAPLPSSLSLLLSLLLLLFLTLPFSLVSFLAFSFSLSFSMLHQPRHCFTPLLFFLLSFLSWFLFAYLSHFYVASLGMDTFIFSFWSPGFFSFLSAIVFVTSSTQVNSSRAGVYKYFLTCG